MSFIGVNKSHSSLTRQVMTGQQIFDRGQNFVEILSDGLKSNHSPSLHLCIYILALVCLFTQPNSVPDENNFLFAVLIVYCSLM